jgi:hypothetical protein
MPNDAQPPRRKLRWCPPAEGLHAALAGERSTHRAWSSSIVRGFGGDDRRDLGPTGVAVR